MVVRAESAKCANSAKRCGPGCGPEHVPNAAASKCGRPVTASLIAEARRLPDSRVDREVDVDIDAGCDVHAGWLESEADARGRADRDRVDAGLELDGAARETTYSRSVLGSDVRSATKRAGRRQQPQLAGNSARGLPRPDLALMCPLEGLAWSPWSLP